MRMQGDRGPTVMWFEPCPDEWCWQRPWAHNHGNTYWQAWRPKR